VQKYKNGINRISASRLQQSPHILGLPVTFFFEGAPSILGAARRARGMAASPAYVTDFLAPWDGIRPTKAFMRIESAKLRRQIVNLAREIAPDDQN
jgi:hypothetical protein